jgi:hypothetical protein
VTPARGGKTGGERHNLELDSCAKSYDEQVLQSKTAQTLNGGRRDAAKIKTLGKIKNWVGV